MSYTVRNGMSYIHKIITNITKQKAGFDPQQIAAALLDDRSIDFF